jgi:ABC-2 type transport system permease protein
MSRGPFQTIWQTIIRVSAFVGKEARLILHQPRLVFSLILGPFLILFLFGIGYRETARTIRTLFVVPAGSTIQETVEEYAGGLGTRIDYAGMTHDPAEADRRLRDHEVDLVIVTPFDPMVAWGNGEQATLDLYHYEIDPIEASYMQIIGQRLADEVNEQILLAVVAQSQHDVGGWREDVAQAKSHAATARQALAAGDTAAAQASAVSLKQELDVLSRALGTGAVVLAGSGANGTEQLLAQIESLQGQADQLVANTADDGSLAGNAAAAAELEASLAEADEMLLAFQEIAPHVLVAPFRSETLSVTQVDIQPMHFYVPAVIALLLQHLAITLGGLSIIREKLIGAMELFRAAPVSALEMLAGKYLSFLLLIGVLAAVLTGLILVGLRVPQLGDWGHYTLVVLALLVTSLGIGFHISLSARSDSQAIQYGMLTLLAAIFFSGFFLPLYRLILPVRVVSGLLPATYGTALLQNVMLRGQSPQLLLLGALMLFGLALMVLAWWRLQRQMVQV